MSNINWAYSKTYGTEYITEYLENIHIIVQNYQDVLHTGKASLLNAVENPQITVN